MSTFGTGWRFVAFLLATAAFSCGDDDDQAGGADGGNAVGASSTKLDACQLARAADAKALFGKPAERDDDLFITDPALLGQCHWLYQEDDPNGGVGSQSLQIYVWDGAEYHSVPQDAEQLDVGQDGYIDVGDSTGIDVGWVQGKRAVSLSYFSIGTGMPEHASRASAMRALAHDVSSRL